MMSEKKRKASGFLLLLAMTLLVLGMGTGDKLFTGLAILLVLASLILGGRWMRGRK